MPPLSFCRGPASAPIAEAGPQFLTTYLLYVPIISACAKICPCIAKNKDSFVTLPLMANIVSKAYNLKKYLCGFPEGGQGPP